MIPLIKYNCIYVWLLLVLASCGKNNQLPPLDETYSYQDKNPFGAYVVHHQLKQLFYHNNLRKVSVDFNKSWKNIADTNALYINVSKHLFLSRAEMAAMLAYVYDGNQLFLSSDHIDQRLLDTLGCKVVSRVADFPVSVPATTNLHLSSEVYNDTALYSYYYFPFYNHFTEMNRATTRALGFNGKGANFIVVFFGGGRIYLHLEPRALSNYFLLQGNNYRYLDQLFSFMPSIPEHVYWDDYYNKRNFPKNESGDKSKLAVLLQYPSFKWAFWLMLLLVATYLFFGGRRRQRIIPALPPNTNTTVTFAETIGRLYLQHKNNRNIADKIIIYLLEHIRNHYYLNTSHNTEDFISTLSRKSNNSLQGTEDLFKLIRAIQQTTEISDIQLIRFNQSVEKFYKNKL